MEPKTRKVGSPSVQDDATNGKAQLVRRRTIVVVEEMMSVLYKVLEWSQDGRPAWLRDAIRRIVTQAELSDEDIVELTELCKQAHGLSEAALVVDPLAERHLPAPGGTNDVSVLAVKHVSDVNALAPGEAIKFPKVGLTVVYGDNGAGKSGYARILKRACRARGSSEPVLPNALSAEPAGTPTAELTIDCGGVETQHMWKDDTPCSADLGAVSVFDSSAAQVYVSDRTEVRFRPFGLDVIDKLAGVCAKVKARLVQERTTLEAQATAIPTVPKDTEVDRLLGNLTALTPTEKVRELSTMNEEEVRELESLEAVLAIAKAEDPAKRAQDLRRKAARINVLAEELRRLADVLGEGALTTLSRARADAAEADDAAKRLAREFSSVACLPGLGESSWQLLWRAAQDYSDELAYPDYAFPHTGDGAMCVLCQQNLNDEARERLKKFAALVGSDASEAAIAKKNSVREHESAIEAIDPSSLARDARDELAADKAELSLQVEKFLDAASSCRAQVLDRELAPSWLKSPPPLDDLQRAAEQIEQRANDIARAADPAEREKTQRRHAELHARHVLREIREQVIAEIKRKARINAYNASIGDTDTRAITRLSTELTKEYVTDVLTAAFDDELKRLGFVSPELELRAAGGHRGSLYHQVQLKYATRAELSKVASEGEARCIALAAFLAELRSAGHRSAIVFDDPVSSLDHRWRESVAKRLVETARERQVIVFTHEIVFLHALTHAAKAETVDCRAFSIIRRPTGSGYVESDLPWGGLPVKKRIGWLKNEWQRAEKIYRVDGEQNYHPVATRIYARLRQTWERAVEEVLLSQVVERFRQSVETQRLRDLQDIEQADLDAINDGMTKCSRWEGGHDAPMAANDPIPTPSELEGDINRLELWVAEIRKRRR